METKKCSGCGGLIESVNNDCESCRFREQISIGKKEHENFIKQLDSKETTDIRKGILMERKRIRKQVEKDKREHKTDDGYINVIEVNEIDIWEDDVKC